MWISLLGRTSTSSTLTQSHGQSKRRLPLLVRLYHPLTTCKSSSALYLSADLASGTSILDHDTNVFFTLPAGSSASLYQLDLNAITNAASSNAVAWEAVSSTSFQQGSGQGVVMAEASNHISMWRALRLYPLQITHLFFLDFFNVPNNPAGSASMFVIHCKIPALVLLRQ